MTSLFVLPDADLDKAVATTIGHRFEIASQSCAVKKVYLHTYSEGLHREAACRRRCGLSSVTLSGTTSTWERSST